MRADIFHKLKLPPSPLANYCKEQLKDLQPVQEERKGRRYLALLYLPIFLIVSFVMCYIALEIPPYSLSGYGTYLGGAFIFSPFFLFIFFSSLSTFELKLYSLNYQERIYQTLNPLLNENERFLACCLGKFIYVPEWIEEDTGTLSYFIFTDERLLVVLMKKSIDGTNKSNRHLENGTFRSVISKICSCPLGDAKKVKFGGLQMPPLYHLSNQKITVIPVDESTAGSWTLGTLFIKNGKLIQETFRRLR